MGKPGKNKTDPEAFARAVAPLFVFTTLIHLGALVSRFDTFSLLTPDAVETSILLIHFPLILIEGFVVGQLLADKQSDFPLWMQIDSRPVRWSLTLAFTYLSIVALQFWDLSFGIINPNPPAEWELGMRLQFFLTMTVGMMFSNYLAATKFFLPLLRLLTTPVRRLPAPIALLVLTLVGLGLGELTLRVLVDHGVGHELGTLQSAVAGGVLPLATVVGGGLVSAILGGIRALRSRRRNAKPN